MQHNFVIVPLNYFLHGCICRSKHPDSLHQGYTGSIEFAENPKVMWYKFFVSCLLEHRMLEINKIDNDIHCKGPYRGSF